MRRLNIWKTTPAEAMLTPGSSRISPGIRLAAIARKDSPQIVRYVLKIHSLPVSRALSLISDSAILIALNS